MQIYIYLFFGLLQMQIKILIEMGLDVFLENNFSIRGMLLEYYTSHVGTVRLDFIFFQFCFIVNYKKLFT